VASHRRARKAWIKYGPASAPSPARRLTPAGRQPRSISLLLNQCSPVGVATAASTSLCGTASPFFSLAITPLICLIWRSKSACACGSCEECLRIVRNFFLASASDFMAAPLSAIWVLAELLAAASGAGCANDTPNWIGLIVPAITINATIAVFRMVSSLRGNF